MQIKPVIAAAGVIASMLLNLSAIAAGAPKPSGDAMNYDGQVASTGEIFILQAMAEDEADAKTGKALEAKAEEQRMQKSGKPAPTVSVRNTRPKTDHHKDARACLDARNNEAIIKCAGKYR